MSGSDDMIRDGQTRMLGSRVRAVKAESRSRDGWRSPRAPWIELLLLASLAFSGCYWRYYSRVMETHLSLLDSYADKIESLARDHRAVPPERWGEFTYPLERARDFARIAAKRFPGRGSLRDFDTTLDRYDELLASLGALGQPEGERDVVRKRAA